MFTLLKILQLKGIVYLNVICNVIVTRDVFAVYLIVWVCAVTFVRIQISANINLFYFNPSSLKFIQWHFLNLNNSANLEYSHLITIIHWTHLNTQQYNTYRSIPGGTHAHYYTAQLIYWNQRVDFMIKCILYTVLYLHVYTFCMTVININNTLVKGIDIDNELYFDILGSISANFIVSAWLPFVCGLHEFLLFRQNHF